MLHGSVLILLLTASSFSLCKSTVFYILSVIKGRSLSMLLFLWSNLRKNCCIQLFCCEWMEANVTLPTDHCLCYWWYRRVFSLFSENPWADLSCRLRHVEAVMSHGCGDWICSDIGLKTSWRQNTATKSTSCLWYWDVQKNASGVSLWYDILGFYFYTSTRVLISIFFIIISICDVGSRRMPKVCLLWWRVTKT